MSDGINDSGLPEEMNFEIAKSFRDILGTAPAAFALTSGPTHVLLAGNEAFLTLTGCNATQRPITEALDVAGLRDMLDRSFRDGLTLQQDLSVTRNGRTDVWACTVWPLLVGGKRLSSLVIELRPAGRSSDALALQRDVAERMLLGALREQDLADTAGASDERATFLANAGATLAQSIDEDTTRKAITKLHLPHHAAWCFVDVIVADGGWRRLGIVHPDPALTSTLRTLESTWQPQPGDPFGLPAIRLAGDVVSIVDDIDDALARGSPDPESRILHELHIGTLLTVPMAIHGRILGAITFVGAEPGRAYSPAEITLARDLALRSAMALDSARLYGEATELRTKAESANRMKSEFLGHMSHELRTPLNAIGGYVDIIDLEIHGPVTSEQRADLERIRVGQRHLLGLINEILSYMQLQGGGSAYNMIHVPVPSILAGTLPLIEPQLLERQITHSVGDCEPDLKVLADPERLQQILVNLLTNAIKFTEPGGSVTIECDASDTSVKISVNDTGIGIEPSRIDDVFEPFVQVKGGLTERQGGVGLGLAISRDLARGMGGDITVTSTPGQGSQFTLTLSRAQDDVT